MGWPRCHDHCPLQIAGAIHCHDISRMCTSTRLTRTPPKKRGLRLHRPPTWPRSDPPVSWSHVLRPAPVRRSNGPVPGPGSEVPSTRPGWDRPSDQPKFSPATSRSLLVTSMLDHQPPKTWSFPITRVIKSVLEKERFMLLVTRQPQGSFLKSSGFARKCCRSRKKAPSSSRGQLEGPTVQFDAPHWCLAQGVRKDVNSIDLPCNCL